jgi:hypothetical protein
VPRTLRTSPRAVARALWLLDLHDPVDVDEIREAWKRRVARAHPDRRSDHPEAAHRLTAAFNDARDVLERWAATGQPWPKPGPRVVSLFGDDDEPEDEVDEEPRPPRRVPTADELRGERRSGLRPGDLVMRPGGEEIERIRSVRAESTTAPVEVELETGETGVPSDFNLASYGCPVCGHCEGPLVPRPGRRPCPQCLADLGQLERSHHDATTDTVLRGIAARAKAGRAHGAELGDAGLRELGRERQMWLEALRRRPKEERRDALLAAFAHGFASWTGGDQRWP